MKSILASITIALFLFVASAASADESLAPDCGSNPGKGVDSGSASLTYLRAFQWEVQWSANCGNNGSTEWEIQVTTDGGNHWNDINESGGGQIDHLAHSPGNGDFGYDKQPTANTCQNGASIAYRAKIWDFNSSIVSPQRTPACN